MRSAQVWDRVCTRVEISKKKNNKKGITPSYFSIEKAEDGGHKQTLEWKKETH